MLSLSLSGRCLTLFAPASALQNIDKMLLQFKGREDKLIETLHTMQERNMAQRTHTAIQKTATLNARANASISLTSELYGVVSELSDGDSDSSGKTLGCGSRGDQR